MTDICSKPMEPRVRLSLMSSDFRSAFSSFVEGWACDVTALALQRTFWEKATILHAEFHRPPESPTPDRYARHYFDMVKLLGRDREKVRSERPLVPGTALVDYSRVPSMTAGYVVSRAGAAKLLAHRQPFGRPIDVDLRFWWECDQLRILGVSPSAIALDDTSEVSSIWDTRDTLTPGQRWRKFTMKLALTVGNAWHRRRLPKL